MMYLSLQKAAKILKNKSNPKNRSILIKDFNSFPGHSFALSNQKYRTLVDADGEEWRELRKGDGSKLIFIHRIQSGSRVSLLYTIFILSIFRTVPYFHLWKDKRDDDPSGWSARQYDFLPNQGT